MTEKRFTYIEQFNGFCDVYDNGKVLSCMRLEYVEKTVNLLNKLHEENQHLKEYNNKLMKQQLLFDVQTIPDTMEIMEANTQLEKENEQLHDENNKIKSLLLKKVEELNDDYDNSVRAGMPTGGIIGELYSFEEICRIMEWIE